MFDRAETWALDRPFSIRGVHVPALAIRSWKRAIDVRITGLAAEMTYYGLISLAPLLTALGASLGFLERILGEDQIAEIEATLVDGLAGVFAEQVAEDVLAPLIQGLLREERAGVAIGSILVALWLASRMFRATIRALDDAHTVVDRRGFVAQWTLGLALALGAVVTLVALLVIIVVGPLLGDGQEIADRFGLGAVFDVVWTTLRWPVVAVLSGAYLTILYRYGPNIDTTWRRCLMGAVVGTLGLVVVSVGFGIYLRLAVPTGLEVGEVEGAAVVAAAQAIGLVLVGVLWLWLSSIVIIAGGVLNAELERERSGGRLPEAGARSRPSRM